MYSNLLNDQSKHRLHTNDIVKLWSLILNIVILANRSWEDAPTVLWTFIATNFGLTIAAIAQASQTGTYQNGNGTITESPSSLTFYEAVEVSNLVWLVFNLDFNLDVKS